MKRLRRDLALLLLIALPAAVLDRLGAFQALAARLEPQIPWTAPLEPGESAAWSPPALREPEAPAETPLPAEVPAAAPAGSPAPAAEAALPSLRVGGSLAPDLRSLLREGWSYALDGDGPQILILHTHACEAFTPAGADTYTSSGDFRTLEEEQSVIALGDVVAAALEERGFRVLHDREKYDWPAYNGAYDRSGEAVRALLEQYPEIRVVIDLHRDSLGGRKTRYVTPDGEDSAQVMLLLTTGENGLYHPNWRENLKLGLELQQQMDRDYPGLARDLDLSPARYNQHLCPGSFLLEVGTEANTLAEAKKAAALFADCLCSVLETHWEG